jgi:hypothetical protein
MRFRFKNPGSSLFPLSTAVLALLLASAAGGPAAAYPINSWSHIASGDLTVSFSSSTAGLAERALAIAAGAEAGLDRYFGLANRARKVNIVLYDQYDEPNGATYARDSLIAVDCRSAPMLFRERGYWLAQVLTHELAHAYSLEKFLPPIDAAVWVGLGDARYEAEAGAYLGSIDLPAWFVEALAQLGSLEAGADRWDPFREMVLKDAVLNGQLLSLEGMARFEGSSRDRELAYNQGFSFLRYLEAEKAGVSIRQLCTTARRYGLPLAAKACYGKSLESLYLNWKGSLSAKYADGSEAPAVGSLFSREGQMVIETAVAKGGDYVIANWGGDYLDFSLFEGRGGRYEAIVRDTGTALKLDRGTGELWLAARAYDYGSGVDDYDLYRLSPGGAPRRATRGTRCYAFDALDGRLVYASYSEGKTRIMAAGPDGAESLLCELPYDIAVDSISLASRDLALLSLSTAEGPRLGILSGRDISILWKDAEVFDAVSAGEGRIAFGSAREGLPHVYWSDLGAAPGDWHRVDSARSGARFPAFEAGKDGARLYYSEYEGGSFRLRSSELTFAGEPAIGLGSPADTVPLDSSERGPPAAPKYTAASLAPIWRFGPAQIALTGSGGESASPLDAYWRLQALIDASLFDAPQDKGLDLRAGVSLPITHTEAASPELSLRLRGSFSSGPLRNGLGFYFRNQSIGKYYGDGIYYGYYDLVASTEAQIGSTQALGLSYDFHLMDYSVGSRSGNLLHFQRGELQWRFSDGPPAVFDPAELGQSGLSAFAAADLYRLNYDEDGSAVYPHYLYDARFAYEFRGGLSGRALLFDSKLGLGLAADGFSFLGASSGGRIAPNFLPTIGGPELFSGYPYWYATVSDSARAVLEIAANPLADRRQRASWFQRFALGARLEAGIVRYFDAGLKTGYPISLELCLKQHYFLASGREGSAYIKAAVPFVDFVDGLYDGSFQVYAGYSY